MTSYDDTKVQLTINRMTGECYENVPSKSSTELYLISQDPTSIAKIDLDAQSRTDAEISSIQSDLNALQSDLNDLSTEVSTLSEWTTTQIDDLIGDVQEVSSQTAQNAQDIADISANLTHSTVRRWEYVEYNGLTFTAEEANSTVAMQKVGSAPDVSLEYSTGDGWNDFIVGETTVTLPNIGDQMVIRAKTTNSGMGSGTSTYNKFVMTGKIAASDSIMYLLKKDGDIDTIPSDFCFCYLFNDCTSLTSAPELPATTLVWNCYTRMFYGCTSLTETPELPATSMVGYCYSGMFMNCTNLTSAPELSATSLASYCYQSMFQGCTTLTTPPELPATTLQWYCYSAMFRGCTSLTQTPELPVTALSQNCYDNMFNGCTSITTPPELPATTLAQGCYANMFNGCASLTFAPELPATTLTQYCYSGMFNGCTSLNEIKIGYTGNFSGTGVPSNAFSNWVNGVSASGTFYYDGEDTTTGASAIPTGWEVKPITPAVNYVDYINTNRADFDTGYTPTESTVLKGKFRGDTVGQYYVGGRATTNGNCRWEVLDQPTWVGFCMPESNWSGRLTATPWDQSKWWEIEMGNYYGNAVCEDGRTASASKSPVTFAPEASTITLKVGLSNYSWQDHWVEYDCAGFKLYEGETLVKDYRPALDPSGVVCFYEEVAQQYEYPYNGTWTAHTFE